MKKVLHLLLSGDDNEVGRLAKEYALKSAHDNIFVFVYNGGTIADEMQQKGIKMNVLNGSMSQSFSTFETINQMIKKNGIESGVIQHDSALLHFDARCVQLENKTVELIPYVFCLSDDYMNQDVDDSRARNYVIEQSFYNAKKVIAASPEIMADLIKEFDLDEVSVQVIDSPENLADVDEYVKRIDAYIEEQRID